MTLISLARKHFTSCQDRDVAEAVSYGHLVQGGECGLRTRVSSLSPTSPRRQCAWPCLLDQGTLGMRAGAPCLASPETETETDGQLLLLFGGPCTVRLVSPPVSAQALGITRLVAAVLL